MVGWCTCVYECRVKWTHVCALQASTPRVSVRGVMRTCKSLEDVAPQQVSNRKTRLLRQRSCFRVARSALRGDLPRFAEHSMSGTTYPDMVFGRIQHFVRAGGTEDTPLLLARAHPGYLATDILICTVSLNHLLAGPMCTPRLRSGPVATGARTGHMHTHGHSKLVVWNAVFLAPQLSQVYETLPLCRPQHNGHWTP